MAKPKLPHLTYSAHRIEGDHNHGAIERAFAEGWAEENNGVHSVLSSLLGRDGKEWMRDPITRRDCRVAATVVTWLGTNVGLSFLCKTIRNCPELEEYLAHSIRTMPIELETDVVL